MPNQAMIKPSLRWFYNSYYFAYFRSPGIFGLPTHPGKPLGLSLTSREGNARF